MALTTYVLKCVLPPARPHHASGARHWFHASRLVRPVAYTWHRHVVSKPVVHVLTVAQGACRYVPMALGVAAGVTMAPGIAAPPFEAPVPSISAASAPAAPFFGGGIMPAAFDGLPASGPQNDVAPASSVPLNVISPTPDGSGPAPLVNPLPPPTLPPPTVPPPTVPPQMGSGTKPQQVPEAPSVALFLPVLALLAFTRRMMAPRA